MILLKRQGEDRGVTGNDLECDVILLAGTVRDRAEFIDNGGKHISGRSFDRDIPGFLSTVVIILFVVAGDEEHAAGEADHEDGDHGKKNLFLHNLLLIMNSAQKKPTLTLHNTTAGA